MCWIYTEFYDSRRNTENAFCAKALTSQEPSIPITTNQTAKMYPELYYWISSRFADSNVESSVLKIRLFWSAIFIFGLFSLYLLGLFRELKSVILVSLILGPPLLFFLIPSTNPSGAQITALVFYTALLNKVLDPQKKTKPVEYCLLLFFSVIGVGSRADSFIFLLLISIGYLVIYKSKLHAWISLCAYILILALVFRNITSILNTSRISGNANASVLPMNWNLLADNILAIPRFVSGLWGYYEGFGWKWEPPLNNMLPLVQFMLWTAIMFFIFAKSKNLRFKVAVLGLSLCVAIIPLYALQVIETPVGRMVQPRYIVALAVALSFVALNGSVNFDIVNNRKMIVAIGTLASLFNFYYLRQQFLRTINGLTASSLDVEQGKSWWWNITSISPNVFLLLAVISLPVISFVLLNNQLKVKKVNP